jgi:hypothetical protein
MGAGMAGWNEAAGLGDVGGEEAQLPFELLATAARAADLGVRPDEELEFLAAALAAVLEYWHVRLLPLP